MNDENDKPQNQPEDDWAMTPRVDAPKAEKTDKWEMPAPIFRVSGGQTLVPSTRKDQPETDKATGAGGNSPGKAETFGVPDFQLEESRPPVVSAPGAHAPAAKKSSKLPLILGGLLAMFLIAAAFLIGIYYLFLSKPEKVEVVNKSQNISSPSNISASPVPAATKTEPPREIEYKTTMVLIPAGEFVMGSDTGEDVSKPAHKVTLPAFYIDKYEVTNAQYKEFCDQTQRLYPVNQYWNENYFLSRPNAPVVGISFEDAKAYADRGRMGKSGFVGRIDADETRISVGQRIRRRKRGV